MRAKTLLKFIIILAIFVLVFLWSRGFFDGKSISQIMTETKAELNARKYKTLDEITNVPFGEIGKISTNSGQDIPVQAFISTFSGKQFKINTEVTRLTEDGNIQYIIFDRNNKYLYELYDLGEGTIKVVSKAGGNELFDLVQEN